ncbi:uncharacterized protein PG986_010283 [Apiospora aurea]|uniref:Uncharacterized protein n=1 Tax=Apiospora aurea TaxID=335848 RepID=A0ABR1QA15_9PEZI
MAWPNLYTLSFWAIIVAWWYATWCEHWKGSHTRAPVNYARCAELHNQILDLGTRKQLALGDGSSNPNPTKPQVRQHPNWFEHWGKRAEAVRPMLSPDLVAFLERAGDAGDDHSFFLLRMVEDPADWTRYVTLYSANLLASHPDGLVFDQKKGLAIMQMDIMDGFVTQNGRQKWYPLEVVLGQWLDMIEMGKIQAVAEGARTRSEKFDPWAIVGYSERQLEETLEVWEQLLIAIEARIPNYTPSNDSATLFDDSEIDLEDAGVLPGFVSEFVAKARRPAFNHIAPGLGLRDAESFAFQQPFRAVPLVYPYNRPEYPGSPTTQFPILLFASSEDLSYDAPPSFGDESIYNQNNDHVPPFEKPWSQVRSYPAGLYFTRTDQGGQNVFEDGVQLVLPFGIGGRGYARTADGARFGENLEAKQDQPEGHDSHHELFQLGYSPFVASHEVRLVQVLRVWVGLVESGAWKVGPEGVLGGTEKWREADTWWHWKKYVVPMSW